MRRALVIPLVIGVALLGGLMLVRRGKPNSTEEIAAAETRATVENAGSAADVTASAALGVQADSVAGERAAVKSDDQLTREIRENVRSNPARAEKLARESRQRFPESANADERDALLVDALINQERIGDARSETYYYNDHHPNGHFAEHLFVMTGVHPMPLGPGSL